ncbi:sigma-70 family RNA polymerase sigma factor [Candidatus Woesearchaeota archaeon]|nr:sigma-70 family RNA polymerase sigma factor [Candidatus Woesearchaeota archaeon]
MSGYEKTNRHYISEELATETAMKMVDNLEKYNPEYRFSAWATVMAKNTLINYLTTRKKFVSLENVLNWSSQTINPLEQLIAEENAESIRKAIDRLPRIHRDVVIGHYYKYKPYKEIAKELGISINTVKTRIRAAKERLRSILKAYGEERVFN